MDNKEEIEKEIEKVNRIIYTICSLEKTTNSLIQTREIALKNIYERFEDYYTEMKKKIMELPEKEREDYIKILDRQKTKLENLSTKPICYFLPTDCHKAHMYA